jgi:putative ABC transport system permease protein
MTVIGIAACTALMITGFGLREGITGANEEQFNRIYKFNMQASLGKNASEAEKNDIKQRAMKDTNIKSLLFAYSKNASVEMENSKEQDAYVVVPEDKNSINNYISLTMNGKDISLNDEGVILTEKLSRMINKRIGDVIKITINGRFIEARVSGITLHYIQHYIYISPAYYERLMGEKLSYNSFYGLLNNTSENYQERTSSTLKRIDDINSIGFKNNIQIDYSESMNSVNSVVLVLIVSAGVLAFVVIYNLTNINIAERRRELATIKLLGFYNIELAAYIYRENIFLTLIGSLAGIFLGIVLNHYILLSAETNVIMFANRISPIYFMYSVLLTILFSMIVNLAMYSRFDRIDMIESLKSVE